MGDENTLPPSKKRAAGRELSRDNPGLDDDEDVSELETGTFKKASDEVLARRKIVKVRRQPATSAPSAPAFNPFAGICLVPPVSTTTDESKKESQVQAQLEEAVDENKKDKLDEETGETCNEKELEDKTEKAADDGEERNLNEKELEDKTEKAANDGEERNLNENELEDKTKKAVNESSADKLNGAEQANSEGTGTLVDKEKSETAGDKIDESKASDDQVQTVEENTVNGDKKEDDIEKKKDINNSVAGTEATAFSSFQQLSSGKNAFTGLVGTGFSSSAFGSPSGSGFSFGSKTDQPALPSFSFGASNNGSNPIFGTTGATENKSEGAAAFPSMNEVSVETGEENEETVFTADSALFEYSDGGWKERGKGEVKVNVSNSGDKKARLVMRGRGNYRLILNAYLYADMKLTKMDKKGITFACVNSASEGKTGLATFALKFKDASIVETFSATVTAHKGETGEPKLASKTPENSPKAAEE